MTNEETLISLFHWADMAYALDQIAEPSLDLIKAIDRKHLKKAATGAGNIRTAAVHATLRRERVAIWVDASPPKEFPQTMIAPKIDSRESEFHFFIIGEKEANRTTGYFLESIARGAIRGECPVFGLWAPGGVLRQTLTPNWDVLVPSIALGDWFGSRSSRMRIADCHVV